MKKLFCLFTILIWAVCLNAQSDSPINEQFFLTGNGSFQTSNKTNYIVIEYEGKNQETLFNEYLVAITKLYEKPKTVDKVENKIIRINAYDPKAFQANSVNVFGKIETVSYGIGKYILQFQFKDGKVRIDAPEIYAINKNLELGTWGNSYTKPGEGQNMQTWISSEKLFSTETPELTGKPKKDEERKAKAEKHNNVRKGKIDAINKYVNGVIKKIVETATNQNSDSDW